jgi:hypothetical protein
MKIEVNINKTYFFVLLGVILIGFGFFFVFAYGGNNPQLVGHSAGEININISGTTKTLQRAINDGDFGGGEIDSTCELIASTNNVGWLSVNVPSECYFPSTCKLLLNRENPENNEGYRYGQIVDYTQLQNNYWITSHTYTSEQATSTSTHGGIGIQFKNGDTHSNNIIWVGFQPSGGYGSYLTDDRSGTETSSTQWSLYNYAEGPLRLYVC